jgi:hypothetical protein
MTRVQDSARRRDNLGQRRSSSQGTRYFEPVVIMLTRTSISSFRAADSLPLRTPHLGRVILTLFSLKATTDVHDAGESKSVQGMGDGPQVPLRQMQVLGGRFQITVPEKNLDGAQVGARFQQVGRPTGVGEHV